MIYLTNMLQFPNKWKNGNFKTGHKTRRSFHLSFNQFAFSYISKYFEIVVLNRMMFHITFTLLLMVLRPRHINVLLIVSSLSIVPCCPRSCSTWLNYLSRCGIVVRHSHNVSYPSRPSRFDDFLDTGLTVELHNGVQVLCSQRTTGFISLLYMVHVV